MADVNFLEETAVKFYQTAVSNPASSFSEESKLVVGVSGGPDSLALLHVLRRALGPDRLIAAHLNHDFRETAAAEAHFVRETAENWGVACVVETVNVTDLKEQSGESWEDAGRRARYHFFREAAEQAGTVFVAVAHHADDQAETVLMNLLRGAGMRGLRGMLPVSPLPGAPRFYLQRPFLTVTRAEIERYCQTHHLHPITDESNRDTTFLRNRIRHELLPELETYNPGVRAHLRQTAEMAAADYALLDALTAEAWDETAQTKADGVLIDRAGWRALPLSLRRGVLRRAVREIRPFLQDITFTHIEQARRLGERPQTGTQLDLPGGLTFKMTYNHLILQAELPVEFADCPQLEPGQTLPLPVPGAVTLADNWRIEAVLCKNVPLSAILTNADPWQTYISLAPDLPLTIRGRRDGERFQPLGMHGRSASVKKLMINRKIDAEWRQNWPIVAAPEHLVWIVGHSLDERMKVGGETGRIVRLRCYKEF